MEYYDSIDPRDSYYKLTSDEYILIKMDGFLPEVKSKIVTFSAVYNDKTILRFHNGSMYAFIKDIKNKRKYQSNFPETLIKECYNYIFIGMDYNRVKPIEKDDSEMLYYNLSQEEIKEKREEENQNSIIRKKIIEVNLDDDNQKFDDKMVLYVTKYTNYLQPLGHTLDYRLGEIEILKIIDKNTNNQIKLEVLASYKTLYAHEYWTASDMKKNYKLLTLKEDKKFCSRWD